MNAKYYKALENYLRLEKEVQKLASNNPIADSNTKSKGYFNLKDLNRHLFK